VNARGGGRLALGAGSGGTDCWAGGSTPAV
jgi:hypothetical protein